MKPSHDFTRWNRAGLSRFQYIDANAVTFLEMLRKKLAEKFSNYDAVKSTVSESGESPIDRQKRLQEQYHGKRGDWAWEIARSFSRAAHIHAGYINAYANEAFLETATQWDNVRKLVEMIDYHPAPPASASTAIALMAKKDRSGTVAKGMPVKYAPPEGGPAVVFETLEEIKADDRLNEIHLLNHDRSPSILPENEIVIHEAIKNLTIGDPILFEKESTGFLKARLITGVRIEGGKTRISIDKALPASLKFTKGDTIIHLHPKDRLSLNGPVMTGTAKPTLADRILRLVEVPDQLKNGDTICIDDGNYTYFRKVEAVRGRRVTLNETLGNLDLSKARVGPAVPLAVSFQSGRKTGQKEDLVALKMAGNLERLQNTFIADIQTELIPLGKGKMETRKTIVSRRVDAADFRPVDPENIDRGGYTTLRLLDGEKTWNNPQNIWVKPVAFAWRTDTYLKNDDEKPFASTIVTGKVKTTSAGDMSIVKTGNVYAWGKLTNVTINDETGKTTLTADEWYYKGLKRFYLQETVVYAHFKTRTRADGWNVNTTILNTTDISIDETTAALFNIGQPVIVEDPQSPDDVSALLTGISNINGTRLTLNDSLEGLGFATATTVVLGNVVRTGHGETKTVKVLGSGDATRSFQSFVFPVEGIAFITDATQSAGVAADITVTVDNMIYSQVSTLKDSKPEDAHYIVRMTEDGAIRIAFGDGVNGRRLPTGKNNVRIHYRLGNGSQGNIPAFSFEKPAKPHRVVKTVRQPFKPSGGNHMEDSASLKESAPQTVLSLERAVSVDDFTHLAQSHSSVWQARAFLRQNPGSRYEHIEVIVVPAQGIPFLKKNDPLQQEIKKNLEKKALPFVRISVTDYVPWPFYLDVTLTIDTDRYVADDVRKQVRLNLFNAFSLKKRKIGQMLYLSEIYKVVEQTQGVTQSICKFDDKTFSGSKPPAGITGIQGDVRVIRALEDQVVYLDERYSGLVISL